MSTLEVNTINPQSGTTITIGGSGDTVSLGSGATQSGFGGTNTPAFLAHCATTNPSVPSGTTTKVVFDAEEYDSDNCYDTSTGRFTPTVSGKYLFLTCIEWGSGSNGVLIMQLYKNGSLVKKIIHNDVRTLSGSGGSIVDMNGTTDYVEIYVYQGSGTTWVADNASERTWFQGFRLVE